MIYTAESVSYLHPDKICDQISDAIVDRCIEQDAESRVAVEAIGGHGKVFLVGEVTTKAEVDFAAIASNTYKDLTGKDIYVKANIVRQSPDIAQGVDRGGAGDQGIMIGYACNDNELKIPQEMYYARKLLSHFKTDAKSQVTVDGERIDKVVLSVQGKERSYLKRYIWEQLGEVDSYCNNTGSFEIGGFDADSGCTGRKIVVDAYGPRVPVGGGAFSGKDPTKVDRSGAYMARWIALDLLNKGFRGANNVTVKLAYVIGGDEPVQATAVIKGAEYDLDEYDCRPQAIIEKFNLKRPIYLDLARNGHFGRKELPWEQI